MPLPTINDVQAVEPILTSMLVGYKQADSRFVASRVFPPVPVDKDSGTYYIFTKKYWFITKMQERAPGQQYARAGIGVESDTYKTLQWALSYPVPDEIRANSQIPMDLETAATQWLAQQSLLRKELSFAADFMLYSAWDNYDNDSATDWDDFSAGDPVANVLTAKKTISDGTGQQANTMVMGNIVHNAIVNHPDILDRLKYTQGITQASVEGALAAIFGLSNYWVASAVYANINDAGTFAATNIIDDDALICTVDPGAGIFGATAGKTFTWAPGGGAGIMMRNRDDLNDTDLIKTKEQWDQCQVASDLGYFFANIV